MTKAEKKSIRTLLLIAGEYLKRNFARWLEQLEASKTDEMLTMDKLISWLTEHLPGDDVTSLIHGDYRSIHCTQREFTISDKNAISVILYCVLLLLLLSLLLLLLFYYYYYLSNALAALDR